MLRAIMPSVEVKTFFHFELAAGPTPMAKKKKRKKKFPNDEHEHLS